MKNISIFVATHKQDIVVPSNSFFKPIQVGAELSDVIFPNMLHDNVGDNISSKNPNYCELTAIYWAWKNCDSDYYGLFHYRRYFSFAKKQYPTITDKFIFEEVLEPSFLSDEITQKYALDEQTMRSVIEDADFIAPQAVLSPGNETVYAQYSISFGHHIEDLERVIYIIENDFPEYAQATRKYLNGILHYPCNMFIMKKEIFHEYCEWLFAVLQKFEQCRNIESYSSIDNRLYGYLAERLTGVFITYLIDKKYKAKFMQRVYFESLNESEHKELLEKKKIEKKNQTRHALRSGLHKVGRTGLNSARIAYNKFVRKQKNELNFEEHILEKSAYATKIQLNSVKDNGNLFFVVSGNVSICIPSDLNVPVNFKLESHDSNTTIVGDIKTYNKQIDKFDANRDYSKISFEFHFYLTNLEQDIILNAKINESLHSQVFTSQILKFKENYWRAASLNISKIDFYNEWFLERRVSKSELEFQRLEKFAVEPLYSIVVPIYKTPKKYLEAMLLSVTEQSYQNFELILINASPRETKLSSYLNEKVVEIKLDKNYGITENTNYGIDAAKGDFICFMDHDDLLELDTLYEYTKYLNQHPDTDMFYCDEDKILNDCFVDPYFKPDFNIDLLYGINYVCHFLCCRASIVKSVERPTSIYDGAQDANMTFRVYEKARHIAHIPKTLYHWRIHEQSTAKDPAQKSYTLESARLAIEHHMQRRGIDCEVVESFKVPRHYEVLYKLKKEPLVSIIILNKNSFELIKNCLDSIFLRSTYKNFEIVLVDNNSDDKELEKYYESKKKKNNVQILH
ncbi:MAG: DUF4422 domain-containing protein, partial [Coriobacteriales bacterium]|nr:DUF4422 domain-containing protein [Coriobacteriales bacterium]